MGKHIKVTSVPIPPPQIPSKTNKTSCDCPSPVYFVKYYKYDHYVNHFQEALSKGDTLLYLTNIYSFTLQSKESKTVYFNNIIKTSLPTICILNGSQYLYKQGISHKISVLKANDSYLYIQLYNHTGHPMYVAENTLSITCNIVLPGHEF